MNRIGLIASILAFFVLETAFMHNKAYAFYDPLTRENNFYGIHILFPSELNEAATLVNSSNGQWGYVTIPIQITDRDLAKWQIFMDEAKTKKLIPIVRLATEPYYKNTSVWRKPTEEDIIDFANFLNSLDWPVENRYVIIFNEVNRFDEWGGETPDLVRYAEILDFSIKTFKDRSRDFYVIMAGLDNAAPNDGIKYIDNFTFIRKMISTNPGAVKNLDGFASHSYPNPGFSQPPSLNGRVGTSTYKYEYELINSVSDKKIPAFITETGWTSDSLSETTVANYYENAYETIWEKDKDKIVAITPFLLNSTGGMFENFSFIINGKRTKHFESTKKISKNQGDPVEAEIKPVEKIKELVKIPKFFSKKITGDTSLTQALVTEYIRIFF